MEPVHTVEGTAVVLDRADIDTDQIIPASRLKRVERSGYADDLFADWRTDPGFVLNQPGAAGARVLVVGRNFGCGSSREHAVWALMDFGFRAVISEQIADIFRGNAVIAGLVPVELPADQVRAVMDALTSGPARTVRIDLVDQRVSVEHSSIDLPLLLDASSRAALRSGTDAIARTLSGAQRIDAFERRRPAWMPLVEK